MAKPTAKPRFQVATAPSAQSRQGKLTPGSNKSAKGQANEGSNDFGGFSAEEKDFLDALAEHRENFSAEAVETRSNKHLKRS
jgi:hypothetical protein